METNLLSISKRELNNLLKEEYKSFSSLVKIIKLKKDSQIMKDYLKASLLDFDNLIDINYLVKGLTMKTFEANGVKYETIARKSKSGEFVPAKWSFWLILTAASKVRKAELKEAADKAGMKEMVVKETSIKKIEAEEKKAKKNKAA